ncbi:MAG TPA: hypothetical protein VFE42_31955 [Chloroflexota bacterium]|nr:hypothetical protein [Chloroflexota bacterium]HZS92084.1 hypothetical protein [Chloroflexota bacterium]
MSTTAADSTATPRKRKRNFTLRLSDELDQAITRIAERQRWSNAQAASRLIELGLEVADRQPERLLDDGPKPSN